ncbi:MAG TPA: phosphatidate cytidylyltransferase [Candidatus Binatia bacterium]|jgi:phosphatidate cytidylyltransferase
MLRQRLATAAIAIPLLIWLILAGPNVIFSAVVLAFTFLSLMEMAAMQRVAVTGSAPLTVGAGMAIALSMWVDATGATLSAGIVVALIGVMLGTLATAEDMQRSVTGAGQILFAALYGGLLLPHLIWLRALEHGPGLVFFVIATSMASDAGGFFAGRAWGKRKLWPTVSPKKTVEGAAGSVAAAVVIGGFFQWALVGRFGFLESVLVTAILSLLAQIGDLSESMIKRAFDAKDSGWIIPGHGGVLDRTDSMVLPIVFTYYYASLTWT